LRGERDDLAEGDELAFAVSLRLTVVPDCPVGVRAKDSGAVTRALQPRSRWVMVCSCGWRGRAPSPKASDTLARHHVQRHSTAALKHVISIERQLVMRAKPLH
jgi:hypothetical protein